MALAGILELRRRRHGTCNSWMDTARTFVPYLNMLGFPESIINNISFLTVFVSIQLNPMLAISMPFNALL